MARRHYTGLDLLRLLAALVIVSYHFVVEYAPLHPGLAAGPAWLALVGLTEAAIDVFFALSGASLALGYGPQRADPDWRRYARGRVLAIYPMYWLGFGVLFVYGEVLHGNNPDVPRWRVVFSLLGLDGYLAQYTATFYKIGEWFLGCLLLLYLLFPALVALLRACRRRAALWSLPVLYCGLVWTWLPRAGAGIAYTHTVLWRLPVFLLGIALGARLGPPRLPPCAPLRWLAGQCYGVFLVHHVLLTIVFVPRLAALPLAAAYLLYLPACFLLAWCLQQAARPLAWLLGRLLPQSSI